MSKGDVIVIRYEGPRGGPGMREMLSPTSAIMGKGLGKDVALITDGRFSGGSHGFVVGHITPEAYNGGPMALVKNGDTITIDAEKRELTLEITGKEMAARCKGVEKARAPLHARRAGQIRRTRHERVVWRGDGYGFEVVKTILTITLCAFCVLIFQSTLAQGLNNSAYDIVQQDRFGIQFHNGDTTQLLGNL